MHGYCTEYSASELLPPEILVGEHAIGKTLPRRRTFRELSKGNTITAIEDRFEICCPSHSGIDDAWRQIGRKSHGSYLDHTGWQNLLNWHRRRHRESVRGNGGSAVVICGDLLGSETGGGDTVRDDFARRMRSPIDFS